MAGVYNPRILWDQDELPAATHREVFEAGPHARLGFQWHLDSTAGVVSAINFYVSMAPASRLKDVDPTTNTLWKPAPASWVFASLPNAVNDSDYLQVCCYALSCVLVEVKVDTATENFSLYGLGLET